jgi:energy-coupling factor transport system permease protein
MHVLVKFVCLVFLAFVLSNLQHYQLIGLVSMLSCIAFVFYARDFTHMLRRVKWLLMILVLIYAFSTPGEYIPSFKLPIRPTYEGIVAGLTQALIIVAMLASLTLVLSSTPRAKLVGGLYQLLSPLKHLGLRAEKFAVRIWLTLHYIESRQPLIDAKLFNLNEALSAHLKRHQASNHEIVIDVDVFRWQDYLLLVLLLLSVLFWVVA